MRSLDLKIGEFHGRNAKGIRKTSLFGKNPSRFADFRRKREGHH
jgi:hypothetical protein